MQQLIWLETPIAGTSLHSLPSPGPLWMLRPFGLAFSWTLFMGRLPKSNLLICLQALLWLSLPFSSLRLVSPPSRPSVFPFDCVLVLPHFCKTSKICKKPKTRRRLRRWLRRQRWLVCNICRLCASDRDLAFICYLAYFHLEGKQSPTRHNPHTHTYTHR